MDNYPHVERESAEGPVKVATGTSVIEGLTGLGAVALSIIGLANVFPRVLLAVATIALGAALLFESGSIAARFSAIVAQSGPGQGRLSYSRIGGGMTTGFLAGAAGIALGILALLGIVPMVLIPISAIAYGIALVMDSGLKTRLTALESETSGEQGFGQVVASETASAYSGIQVIVGIGAVTLGILALVGINTLILSLVAMLIVSAAILVGGSIVGTRMVSMLRS